MKVNFTSNNVEISAISAKGFKDAIRIIKNSESAGHVVVTREVEGNTVAVAAFISTGAVVHFTEPAEGVSGRSSLPGSYTIPAKLTPVALPPGLTEDEIGIRGAAVVEDAISAQLRERL